jgi:hypothetical protein
MKFQERNDVDTMVSAVTNVSGLLDRASRARTCKEQAYKSYHRSVPENCNEQRISYSDLRPQCVPGTSATLRCACGYATLQSVSLLLVCKTDFLVD